MMRRADTNQWVDIFATSHHPSDPSRSFWGQPCFLPRQVFRNCTIRQSFRVTIGHHRIRLRFSNQYSTTPLPITRVTVGHSGTLGTTEVTNLSCVTFAGLDNVNIPPGATWVSDPVDFSVATGQDVTVSIFLEHGKDGDIVPTHEVAKATSFMALGDHSWSKSLPDVKDFTSWYFVAAIEADISGECLVCLGDSITDSGDRSWDSNVYRGWVNVLFKRMQANATTRHISVLNAGISGDQLWEGGIARLERDVFKPGVKYLFILMGTNDLAWTPNLDEDQQMLTRRLIAGYKQILERAASWGIKVVASPILPKLSEDDIRLGRELFRERTRREVNRWIRVNLECVDWAEALSGTDDRIMDAKYRLGEDYTHPNLAGNQIMAEYVDLALFA